mmetsp:Transcript_33773/g.84160  ORF Transcript_33773/g.84160 Transcript_33773/m.84160 type:complete len:230 (+) Transcript_33773:294-983(+)
MDTRGAARCRQRARPASARAQLCAGARRLFGPHQACAAPDRAAAQQTGAARSRQCGQAPACRPLGGAARDPFAGRAAARAVDRRHGPGRLARAGFRGDGRRRGLARGGRAGGAAVRGTRSAGGRGRTAPEPARVRKRGLGRARLPMGRARAQQVATHVATAFRRLVRLLRPARRRVALRRAQDGRRAHRLHRRSCRAFRGARRRRHRARARRRVLSLGRPPRRRVWAGR